MNFWSTEPSSFFFWVGLNDDIVRPDPLLTHFREENERLENEKSELVEKVKFLGEEIAERERTEYPTCEAVDRMRDRIRAMREEHQAEKRRSVFPQTKCLDNMHSFLL